MTSHVFEALERIQYAASRSPILSTFAALGGLWTISSLYHLISFVHLHYVHRSKLNRLKEDTGPPWALITGASDGIGRGFAEELCSRGFNVILHGRNQTKLDKVKAELQEQWPDRGIQTLTLDVMLDVEDTAKIEAVAARFLDLNLKVLVNNVAGDIHPLFSAHSQRTADDNRKLMNGNFIFATEMTRVLLPTLIRDKPSLILNIGSGSARLPCPYFAIGSAAKAFLEQFSRSLAAEMIAEGHPEVEVQYVLVGMCSTGSEPRPVSLLVPNSRQFAKSSLALVGSGYRTLWGYGPHALQFETILLMPRSILERICIGMVSRMKKEQNMAAK